MVLIDHGPFTYLRSKDLRKLKVLTSEQKQWLGNQILQKITTVTCLHERYSLSIDVLKKYRKLVGKGIIPNSTSGQPKALSATRCQLIREYVSNNPEVGSAHSVLEKSRQTNKVGCKPKHIKKNSVACKTRKDFDKFVNKQIKLSRSDRGMAPTASSVSRSTLLRIKKELNIGRTTNVQVKPSARVESESDIRNFFSDAAVLSAFQTGLPPHCVINFDPTTYESGIVR